jgi:hypothetical protein
LKAEPKKRQAQKKFEEKFGGIKFLDFTLQHHPDDSNVTNRA